MSGAADAGAPPAVSLAEAQAFARVETGEEEALLVGLVRSASALCEAFTGQLLIRRPVSVELRASGDWQRVGPSPMRAISGVEALGVDGSAEALAAEAYGIDIDARGDGWVRLTAIGEARRVRVTGEAGMASDCNGVPEPIRQGILRLVAHLFASRDQPGGEPPAAVTALWRPYRRMRLA